MAKKTSFSNIVDFLLAADLVVLTYEDPDLYGVFVVGYRSVRYGVTDGEPGFILRFDWGHGEEVITRTILESDVDSCVVRDGRIADVFVNEHGHIARYSFEGFLKSKTLNKLLTQK